MPSPIAFFRRPDNRDKTDKTLSLGGAQTLLAVLSVLADVFDLALNRHLTILTGLRPGSRHIAVQKSPSLTVREDWLSTVVSPVVLAVSKTICFR